MPGPTDPITVTLTSNDWWRVINSLQTEMFKQQANGHHHTAANGASIAAVVLEAISQPGLAAKYREHASNMTNGADDV
jgi:hypothetical protein